MAFQRPSLKPDEPLINTEQGRFGTPSTPFLIYMRDQRAALEAAPAGFDPVALTGQGAAIATTSIPTDGDLSAGLYRVTWYARITTAAGVSSSLTVSFGWTDGAISQTHSGAAITGNTTTTFQSGTLLLRTDAASPITYATTYASNAAGVMRYSLYITLERLAAL